MVKLSLYSRGYDDGKYLDNVWDFWTEEEKSLVVNRAYEEKILTSKQIQPFLKASRIHSVTQFIVPLGTAALYFGVLKHNLAQHFFRMSPMTGNIYGVGLVTLTTLYWLNLSPFYLKKEDMLEKLMEKLDKKFGPNMKYLNDAVPRFRTTREIDRRTQQLYNERHSQLTGKLFGEEDLTPAIFTSHPARDYMSKKMYL